MEAGTHHLTADKLVRALVWISQFVVNSNLITSWVTRCILANISIWLWHSCHIWNTSNDITWISCFIATRKVVSMVLSTTCNHRRGSILISDSMFGSLTLLILYEVLMSSGTMVSIWVVSSMMRLMWHLLRQLFITNSDHWPLSVTHSSLSFLLLCLSIWPNEYDVTLINTSIIWATVRSLLVASP